MIPSSSNNSNRDERPIETVNIEDQAALKKRRKKEETEAKKKKQKCDQILDDLDNEVTKKAQETLVRDIFSQRKDIQFDHSSLTLKEDHKLRPIWICSGTDGLFHIFMETFSPIYQQAYDFLVAVAEPVSRPENLHEYILTEYSLFAAVSIGMNTEQIIQVLEKLSKVKLPDTLITFIKEVTRKYGNVKLVLQKNRFFIESHHFSAMEKLYDDSVISSAAVIPDRTEFPNIDKSGRFIIRSRSKQAELEKFQKQALASNTSSVQGKIQTEMIRAVNQIDDEDDDADDFDVSSVVETYYQFEINPNEVEHVKKRCIEIGLPTLEEYDFRNDVANKSLSIDLKPTTTIRSYQEKSLSKMFSNGRARSGIIVLPCGAGKTLVGVTAACTVKKRTLVLCINSVSVLQWKNQFKLWSTIDENRVIIFTSQDKDPLPKDDEPLVIITTYTMLTHQRKRSGEAKEVMDHIESREWGLLVLDEVHVVPATMFRNVSRVKSHCKLGLTATLVREDSRIEDLYFLIGPKLYEANWLDLQKKGHLANVQCVEVWCPMTAEFYAEYLTANAKKKTLFYVMNPNKFRACEFLIRYHEKQGDKIIVFSDNVFSLQEYAERLKLPYIFGNTKQQERVYWLNQFRQGNQYNTIFISKVGDTAIDIPEATVIIQISSHFGSRRQEAQRLGRILRPKGGGLKNQQAYFYTLVSQDTQEMYYSTKRQQFLINQGYSFRVLPDIQKYYEQGASELGLSLSHMTSKKDELEMLAVVRKADDARGQEEKITVDDESAQQSTSMAQLSGGQGVVYQAFDTSGGSSKKKRNKSAAPTVHPLFKNRASSSKD
ncbi:hypothetical protein C9374_005160 [Naegleria lovaniensis]|uniref:DNA 3'-5' helicase n=1 Tax=Naegleria lovaniensis TaxID=51637 RepID=A0AA88KKF0_NAELO|nr:uncharacterized protein C9374_005160 [Naegleria lovaniensis]KAG2382580.1 hypothetical protein C9374_005160 [Naegleria lovaniensis]